MEKVVGVLDTLNNLCTSIIEFRKVHNDGARYRSPIIDHYNPEYYEQRSIIGLNKFLSTAEHEREHVQAVSINTPHYSSSTSMSSRCVGGWWTDKYRYWNRESLRRN